MIGEPFSYGALPVDGLADVEHEEVVGKVFSEIQIRRVPRLYWQRVDIAGTYEIEAFLPRGLTVSTKWKRV
ncbi:hypothetical protein RS9917_04103 [Synechococcus sp. RS9917]|nr:hypothetical protein RS9917_04103 [Synechococcus sp. RS9917]